MLVATIAPMRCRTVLLPMALSCLLSACDSGEAATETDGPASDTDSGAHAAVCDEAPEIEVDCGLIQGCSSEGDTDGAGTGSGGADECPVLGEVQQCVLDALGEGKTVSYRVQESPGGQFDYTRSYRVATDGRVWWSSQGWGDLCYESSSGVRQGDAYACTDWDCAVSAIEGGSSVADCGSETMCEEGV